ncbi:exodeoxyribonuclease I, partial [Salmonella enterica subsp. enterica serovar Kentucky]
RNFFYRNFYVPFSWSWQPDNSSWYLLDFMRACFALRRVGINWPDNYDGLPSLSRENLSQANWIEHSNEHDAMAVVYANIAMAQ